ncbi:Methionine aminopeptidase 1D, chloroplastic/mitochondrial [Actinomortierella wolfii]|nr:Methionine aminopeptidase 1D, chloroplastic/mitochondrial [Actinomortierella wolfii]
MVSEAIKITSRASTTLESRSSNAFAPLLGRASEQRAFFHVQSTASAPRHRRRFASTLSAKEDNPFGRFSRVVPTSLKLGVDPPDVNSLVPAHILRPHYALKGTPSEWAVGIPIHTAESIQGCREAGQLAKEILQLGGTLVKPGVSTEEIDRILHEAIIARGAYPSPLNYMGFPKSICTSVSNVIAHGIPDHRRLEDGDIINLDITVYLNGYHGDTSATFLVGNVDKPGRDLVERTKEALDKAIEICAPGVPFNQIGKTIQAVADKYGYTISQEFSDNEEEGEMEAGMIFTIEPMFCQGSAVGMQWPDRWTVSTADGGRSAQWEHTVSEK